MGQATYVAGEEDLQTFTGSSLKGTVSIEGMKSSPPCTIDFRGVEFESGSKLRMNASDVAIDLRGVTLRSGCEMLFERNAARVFDLRLMNISSGARIGFRNQPLNELLTAGTNLAQFSFSLVTFAAKKARAYLADDPSRTHLPIEYKATQGSPDATVPKIFGTDVPEAQVLESYRQLIGYFDSARDFRTAESLHFSEMALAQYVSRNELSRRFGFFGGILSWLSFHNFYRLFAGYGTSVFRSGIWLAIFLLFVFPLFFLVVGFNVNSGSTTNRGSEYIGFSTLVCTSTNSCIAQLPSLANAYFTATTYTILLAGLQKDDMIYPANKWGLFGKAVVAPISLSQLALFIIALKRRFRRGAT